MQRLSGLRLSLVPLHRSALLQLRSDTLCRTAPRCDHDLLWNVCDRIVAQIQANELWQLGNLERHMNQLVVVEVDQAEAGEVEDRRGELGREAAEAAEAGAVRANAVVAQHEHL